MPPAIFAIRSAVAGATTTRSAARLSSIWPISASSVRSKRSRVDLLARQRRDGQRRDEFLGAARVSTGTTPHLPLPQPADQVERLVGRDTAADDQQDFLVRQHLRIPASLPAEVRGRPPHSQCRIAAPPGRPHPRAIAASSAKSASRSPESRASASVTHTRSARRCPTRRQAAARRPPARPSAAAPGPAPRNRRTLRSPSVACARS
jgi:hypothetical protein